MRKKSSFFTPVLWVPLLACSSNNTHHTITTADAAGSGSGSGSGSAAPCTAAATYGSALMNEFAETVGSGSSGSNTHRDYFDGDLNADTLYDTLELQFWYGLTEFSAMDVAPGTYALTADDADFNSCGLCAIIFTDQGSDGKATDVYLANSGSVTLTQATGSNFVGSVSNLTFAHVMFDSSGNQSIADTCSSKIASASFSAPLMVGSAAAAGEGLFGGHIQFKPTNVTTLGHRHH